MKWTETERSSHPIGIESMQCTQSSTEKHRSSFIFSSFSLTIFNWSLVFDLDLFCVLCVCVSPVPFFTKGKCTLQIFATSVNNRHGILINSRILRAPQIQWRETLVTDYLAFANCRMSMGNCVETKKKIHRQLFVNMSIYLNAILMIVALPNDDLHSLPEFVMLYSFVWPWMVNKYLWKIPSTHIRRLFDCKQKPDSP